MSLIILDEEHGPVVRVVCPNCGARNPVIRAGSYDSFTVLFPTCGANERYDDGVVTVVVPCRVKKRT